MYPGIVPRMRSLPQVETLEDRNLPSTAQYVTALYQGLLHRTPAPSEVAQWANQINNGLSASQVAVDFTTSAEYRTDLVVADYQNYLGRTASPTEIASWVNALNAGTNEFDIQAGFLASDEFFAKNGNAVVPWLEAVYQDTLGRPIDPAGQANWTGLLLGKTLGRFQVAEDIITSPEGLGLLVNAAYNDLLGRAPDPDGQAHWIAALQHGLMPSQLAAGFASSNEFIANQGGLDANNQPGNSPSVEPGPVDGFGDPFFSPIVPPATGGGSTGSFTGGGTGGVVGGFTGGGTGGASTGGATGGFTGGATGGCYT